VRKPPSQSHGMSSVVWAHGVTSHPTQVNVACLNPATKAGTQFTYP